MPPPQVRGTSLVPNLVVSDENGNEVSESTPLLSGQRQSPSQAPAHDAEANREGDESDDSGYEPGSWNHLGKSGHLCAGEPAIIVMLIIN